MRLLQISEARNSLQTTMHPAIEKPFSFRNEFPELTQRQLSAEQSIAARSKAMTILDREFPGLRKKTEIPQKQLAAKPTPLLETLFGNWNRRFKI